MWPNVFAHQDCRETLWLSAGHWDVNPMMIVKMMRSVISQIENVNPFASMIIVVPRRLTVRQETTGNTVLVTVHILEMAMSFATSVRLWIPNWSNQFIKPLLIFIAAEIPEYECQVDRDCPPQKACIDYRCQNPCLYQNPCTGDLVCTVEELTSGKKVVACSCPPGTVLSDYQRCIACKNDAFPFV